MNIFIIEDDVTINRFLLNKLQNTPQVNTVKTMKNSLDINSVSFHLSSDIILFLPSKKKTDQENIQFIHKIQNKAPQAIIIILSPHKSPKFMEACLYAGAHDFIHFPIQIELLRAKILRWKSFSQNYTPKQNIQYRELKYSIVKHEFYFKSSPLKLTKNNKELLLLFLKSPEAILNNNYLQEKIWGDTFTSEKSRNIRSNIQLLRHALPAHCSKWIQTIRGEGYILRKV